MVFSMGNFMCWYDTQPQDRVKEFLGWPECLCIPVKFSLPSLRKQRKGKGCGRRKKEENFPF